MATKSKSIVLSLPATDCFELVKKLGNDRCFKENESNEEGIIWTAHNYTLETWITPISENKTGVRNNSQFQHVFDMFGHLDQHVKFFAVQLKNEEKMKQRTLLLVQIVKYTFCQNWMEPARIAMQSSRKKKKDRYPKQLSR